MEGYNEPALKLKQVHYIFKIELLNFKMYYFHLKYFCNVCLALLTVASKN